MPDISILQRQSSAVPLSYALTGTQEILIKSVAASFDGSGAAVSWVPALQILDPSGFVLGTYVLDTTLAAGASADVTWFPGRVKPCPTPVVPTPIGTLFAWYDFSDSTTITLDGSGNISQIKDKTGNGHDASQGTAANRPGTATVNGLQAGLFSKANATTLITALFGQALLQPFSVAYVFTQDSGTGATYFPGPFCGDHGNANAWCFLNGPFNAIALQAGGGAISTAITAPFTQQLVVAIYNGGSSSLRLNAGVVNGTLGGEADTLLTLGRGNDNAGGHDDHLDGKLCELLFFSGALTASQISLNQTYLKGKWATP